ncbi:SRPBCC family protein [Caenimonas koreensis]|uniref:SRPBCC family protein n=1 Tax=Caenimonas koreensis TaxID=367474 RepID=UPI00378517ED
MTKGTVRFHRVLKAKPERVYRALLDADALVKWLPPFGFTAKMHSMDARVGGGYKMSFTNFSNGASHSFAAAYQELVANEKVRYTNKFDDVNLPGEMQTTIDIRPVMVGTEINIVQEGIAEMIPVEMCYLGWQESLVQLALLVEPEIEG